MRDNPFSGPAHHVALRNALEREHRPGAYLQPPPTGGAQISTRLSEPLLTHLDVVGKAAGWTRVQVLTALIERGLFDLYEILSDETGEAIMNSLANQVVPTMQADSSLTSEAKRLAREVVGDVCVISPAHRPESFWVEGTRQPAGIPRLLVIVDRHSADDFIRIPPSTRAELIERLRIRMQGSWTGALSNPGTEPQYVVTLEMASA